MDNRCFWRSYITNSVESLASLNEVAESGVTPVPKMSQGSWLGLGQASWLCVLASVSLPCPSIARPTCTDWRTPKAPGAHWWSEPFWLWTAEIRRCLTKKDQCPRNPSLHSPTGRGGLGKGTADWPAEVTCVSGLIGLGAGHPTSRAAPAGTGIWIHRIAVAIVSIKAASTRKQWSWDPNSFPTALHCLYKDPPESVNVLSQKVRSHWVINSMPRLPTPTIPSNLKFFFLKF